MDIMMRPQREVRAVTGLSKNQIQRLVPIFAAGWEQAREKAGIGRNPKRPGRMMGFILRHVLIIVLYYLKGNDTFDKCAYTFSLPRSTVYWLIKRGLDALIAGLDNAKLLPSRDIASVVEFLNRYPETKKIFVDGSDRPIRRPKKNSRSFTLERKSAILSKINSSLTIRNELLF